MSFLPMTSGASGSQQQARLRPGTEASDPVRFFKCRQKDSVSAVVFWSTETSLMAIPFFANWKAIFRAVLGPPVMI